MADNFNPVLSGLTQAMSMASMFQRAQQQREQLAMEKQKLQSDLEQRKLEQDFRKHARLLQDAQTLQSFMQSGAKRLDAGGNVDVNTPVQRQTWDPRADMMTRGMSLAGQFEADPARTVDVGTLGKWQAPTLEESRQQAAMAHMAPRMFELRMRGQPLPPETAKALGQDPSERFLPEEIPGLIKEAGDIRRSRFMNVPAGAGLFDTEQLGGTPAAPSADGTPAPAAAAPKPVVQVPPLPSGDFQRVFLPAFARKKYGPNATVDQLTPDDTIDAFQKHAMSTKDPATVALAHELTQARLDKLRADRAEQSHAVLPGTREYRVAQDLAYGRMTFSQFRMLFPGRTGAATSQKLDIYDTATGMNPNFSAAAFEMGFRFASNPKIQQQLAAIDNVKLGIEDLLKASDEASRTGVTAINKLINKLGYRIGARRYSNFHAAQIGFADELSGSLGFGTATDMSRQMGVDMTDGNLSPENFRAAILDVVEPFIARKRQSLIGQMGVYGMPGMSPAASNNLWGGQGSNGGSNGSGLSLTWKGHEFTFRNQKDMDQFRKDQGIQ